METPPPATVDQRDLLRHLVSAWGLAADEHLRYVPKGAGSYHWIAAALGKPAYFITVDDLDTKPWIGRERDETFEGLRFVAHAGAPCPAPLKRAAIERFGAEALVEFYGSTEGQFTVCSTPEWLERPGTVGRARAGRRLFLGPLDDEAGEQPDGVGTIWCEAPSFARFEYFGDPMSTSWAWAGDAFSVGDLGRLDEAGYLFLSGRRSDLIITGGVNVYPAEIEEVLGHLVGVLEVCAFGLDDERWGQRVCVAVVGAPGLRPADVADHAAATLAPFKRPKEIHLVTELPVGPTGKVLRRALPGLLGVA